MKKLLISFSIIVMLLFCSISAYATNFDDSGMWEYQTYGSGVELTKYNGTQTDVYVPNKITKENTEYAVLKLGDELFKGNTSLNSATLGEGITEIGVSTFENATNMVCIVTPKTLTTIGNKAFSGCTSFNSVILYDMVTSIGENAFAECSKLNVYCNENSIAHIYMVSNNITYTILDSITTAESYIQDDVTYYILNGKASAVSYSGGTEVIIPATVIGFPVTELHGTFEKSKVQKVTLPEGITLIGSNTFNSCSSLTEVNIPDSVETIGENAFVYCSQLKNIHIPDNVTSIGKYAFRECRSLTTIKIPSKTTTISDYMFYGCSELTDVVMHDNLTSIEEYAFYNCKKLSNIKIPDSVTKIATYAFYNCKEIKGHLKFSDNLTSIESSAFFGCTGLTAITLGRGLTSFSNQSILDCRNLMSITIPETVETLSFYNYATVLIVQENSPAHKYAEQNNFVYYLADAEEPELYVVDGVKYAVKNSNAIAYGVNSDVASTLIIPETVNNYPVNKLAPYFTNSKVYNLTLPKSIKEIPTNAFAYSYLSSIVLPEGLTHIAENAFHYSQYLTSITIPQSLKRIESDAFSYCNSIANVYISDLKAWCEIDFLASSANPVGSNTKLWLGDEYITELTLTDDIDFVGRYAFSYNSYLTSVNFPESPIEFGRCVFEGCTNLKSIVLPDWLTEIPPGFIRGCVSLTNIVIPDSVTVIGAAAFSRCESLTEINIPKGVTQIENDTFFICTSLTKVIIPDSVTTIGSYAFYNCKNLKEVIIPDSVTTIKSQAFDSCKSLEEVIIPDSVTTIESYAFWYCTSLSKVVLSKNLTSIETGTFDKCNNLVSIVIPASVKKISNAVYNPFPSGTILLVYQNSYGHTYAVNNNYNYFVIQDGEYPELIIQDGVTYFIKNGEAEAVHYDGSCAKVVVPETIGGYPVVKVNSIFKNNTSLTEIILNCKIKTISHSMFYDCSNLTKITLPDELTLIETNAFYGCSSLEEIEIPDNVTSIYPYCFYNCTSLKTVKVSENLKYINAYAFYNCRMLENLTIPDTVISIGTRAFFDCVKYKNLRIPYGVEKIYKEAFRGCASVTELTIPDTVTIIEDYGFSDMSNLKSIVIPDSVVSMGSYAFNCCYSLQKVTFGSGLTNIGSNAFASCVSLDNVYIPDNIKSIGNNAFYYCIALKNLKIGKGVETIRYSAFSDCESLRSVVIPGNVIEVQSSAFIKTKITKLILEDGVEKIGENTFSGFWGIFIDEVVIPETVTDLKLNSFSKNTLLYVYEDSYAHKFVVENGFKYAVLKKTPNPEIAYGSKISGVATYTDGTVTSGATVEIIYNDGTVKETVTTDENGNYEFTYAEVGRYTIRVTDTAGNTASEVVSVKRMNVFDVYLAGDTNLILKKGYAVSGTVSPGSAKVTIADTSGNIISTIDTTDGTFAFSNITRGEYVVKAETENGSKSVSIYISNEDITDISIVVEALSSTISGDVKIENRDGTFSSMIWVNIDLIDAEGNVVTSVKTDKDGKYKFEKIPAGYYNIVATTSEMRPAWGANYDKSFELTGYGFIEIGEAAEYIVNTIILREEKINLTTITGQVTTNAAGTVFLTDENGSQIQLCHIENDGHYKFKNIPDGLYIITAITNSDGMGFVIITIENGVINGNTKIHAVKTNNVKKLESVLDDVPDEVNPDNAVWYKEIIQGAKNVYDNLSKKEQKQVSKAFIDKLNNYINFYSSLTVTTSYGVDVENEESLISANEIGSTINFVITVNEIEASDAGDDGINSEEEYETEKIKDKKGNNKKIAKYYDITLSKNGQNISNIQKQTETNGKLLITMEIPEEYRGYTDYSFIHMHKGEVVTLVDLDNNPDTVTFEIDKFSTFALAYSEVKQKTYPASIIYDAETGEISVSSTENGTLYIATYNGERLSGVVSYDVVANATATDYDFSSNQAAFVWNNDMEPLCSKFTIEN